MTTMRPTLGAMSAATAQTITLLVFEAGGCLLGLPDSEVALLEAPAPAVDPAALRVDLGEYLAGRPAAGPWLRWHRGEECIWLRIDRVLESGPCAIRAISPLASSLRRGVFWAAGLRAGDVFLLLDPARLAEGAPAGAQS